MQRKRYRKTRALAVTLQDVAEQAGVSTATVSRYLASPDQVREERRARIEAAIAKLGYIPHGAARALASQRSRTIGAIVPTLDNAIFAQGIQAFQARLQSTGYTLFVASSNYSLKEESTQGETLIARGVDGMLLVGSDHDETLYARLKQSATPYVNTWSFDGDAPHPCVGFDNFDAASRQTAYLFDIGHRRFGVISGITRDNDRARKRLEGILSTLRERGVALPESMVFETKYDINSSRTVMNRLLSCTPRPTAVICGNDVLAYGALIECQVNGLRIPKDVSVVGFDDLPMSQHFQPPLTTIHVPSQEMGRTAADFLLANLNGENISSHTKLEADLILRASTAPPGAH